MRDDELLSIWLKHNRESFRTWHIDILRAVAEAAAAEEREACLTVCEVYCVRHNTYSNDWERGLFDGATMCAEDIRSRRAQGGGT